MDGQQQFLKPTQHVPFYVKRPITIDTSSHPHLFAYNNGGAKPASYSVDLSHSRFSRAKHTDQLSEPINKGHSKSLRDVFEKAILRGDVAIYPPDEDHAGVMRNPSFITASLPRPDKHKRKSATIGGDNYMHIGQGHNRYSGDYFIDSSSESDSESVTGGRHNEAYMDDASSTVSDEMFKSASEGPTHSHEEEEFHIQPLPHLLDIDGSHQAGRSTLGGFFKPKYRDYPRNNVHRSSEREHKETIDSSGTSRHNIHRSNSCRLPLVDSSYTNGGTTAPLSYSNRLEPSKDSGRLPRTRLPSSGLTHADVTPQSNGQWVADGHTVDSVEHRVLDRAEGGLEDRDKRSSRESRESPRISHNKYLPKRRRHSRPHSPRLSSSRQETVFNDLEDIVVASPEIQRRQMRPLPQQPHEGRLTSEGSPLEQMEMEDPPWMKAEIRERRRRRNKKICVGVVVLMLVVLIAGLAGLLSQILPPPTNQYRRETTTQQEPDTGSTVTPHSTKPSAPDKQNITLTFDGSMRVTNREYNSNLSNLNSPQSKALSDQFCGTMENVFATDPSNNDFLFGGCDVTGFRDGSVIIKFTLNLKSGITTVSAETLINMTTGSYFCFNDTYIDPSCVFIYSHFEISAMTPSVPAVTLSVSSVGSSVSAMTSVASGVTSAASGVTLAASGVTSGVTSAASGVTSAASGVTSAASGATSAASGATSAASGATSAASGVTSAASGVTSAASGVTSSINPMASSTPNRTYLTSITPKVVPVRSTVTRPGAVAAASQPFSREFVEHVTSSPLLPPTPFSPSFGSPFVTPSKETPTTESRKVDCTKNHSHSSSSNPHSRTATAEGHWPINTPSGWNNFEGAAETVIN